MPLPFVVENEFAKALFEGAVSSGAVDGFIDNATPLADDGLETSPIRGRAAHADSVSVLITSTPQTASITVEIAAPRIGHYHGDGQLDHLPHR